MDSQTLPTTELPNELVLVVDDELSVRETIAFNLRREGLRVAQAATGSQALALATDLDPDAIVLDVMLPEMTGYEVCRAVRERSAVPILMLFARGEEIDRIVGLDIGADDYLTKPFAMRELIARVRAMLRRGRMVKALAARSAPEPAAPDDAESGSGVEAPRAEETEVPSVGPIEIDHPRRQVLVRGEDERGLVVRAVGARRTGAGLAGTSGPVTSKPFFRSTAAAPATPRLNSSSGAMRPVAYLWATPRIALES